MYMFMLTLAILLVIALFLVMYYRSENFSSCNSCTDKTGKLNSSGIPVLNPFIWPYSGTSCVDKLYSDMAASAPATAPEASKYPLASRTTPDHVELQ
jgi:hypothetical protein